MSQSISRKTSANSASSALKSVSASSAIWSASRRPRDRGADLNAERAKVAEHFEENLRELGELGVEIRLSVLCYLERLEAAPRSRSRSKRRAREGRRAFRGKPPRTRRARR